MVRQESKRNTSSLLQIQQKTENTKKTLQNTKMPKNYKISKIQKKLFLKHIGLNCMHCMSLPFQLGVGVRV